MADFKLMSEWDAMRIADVLTIAEAACCIVGIPAICLGSNKAIDPYLEMQLLKDSRHIESTDAIFGRVVDALCNSVRAGKLQATDIVYRGKYQHIRMVGDESEGYWEPVGYIDAWMTLIDVDVLKSWLESRNMRPPFFFPSKQNPDIPDYLNPNHPRYSGKLAASVKAWEAMGDENLLRGKTPIPAMTEWLETRYKDFGLIHRQDSKQHEYKTGDRNDGAIKEAAKVANWQTAGGAPKTPEKANLPSSDA